MLIGAPEDGYADQSERIRGTDTAYGYGVPSVDWRIEAWIRGSKH